MKGQAKGSKGQRIVSHRPGEEYTLSTTDAARIIGINPQSLTSHAKRGGIDHVLKGLGIEKPRYYFHPDDVEKLRVRLSAGRRPQREAARKPITV